MFPLLLFNPLSVLVSLSTLFGVVIHDTKIDQLTVAVAAPAIVVGYEGMAQAIKFSDPHTHTERVSLSEAVRNMNSQLPRIQPRNADDKKYRLQKYVTRGHHAFDSYNLPFVV